MKPAKDAQTDALKPFLYYLAPLLIVAAATNFAVALFPGDLALGAMRFWGLYLHGVLMTAGFLLLWACAQGEVWQQQRLVLASCVAVALLFLMSALFANPLVTLAAGLAIGIFLGRLLRAPLRRAARAIR